MKKYHFYLITLIFVLSFSSICYSAAEALTNKTFKQTGNLGYFYTSESTSYSGSSIHIGNADGVNSVTEITFRVMRSGSNSNAKFSMDATRSCGRYGNPPYTLVSKTDMYYTVLSTTFSDTNWHTYTVTIPDNGYDEIVLSDHESYYDNRTRFYVEIQNVKYYDYTGTYSMNAYWNSDSRAIEFYITAIETIPNLNITINGKVSDLRQTFYPGTTLFYSDTSVTTDKFYSYSTKYGFAGRYMSGLGYFFDGYLTGPSFNNIYTYSDAYYAKIAAEDAKKAANDSKVSSDLARGYLDGTANGGKSLSATYDKANSANNNSWYTGTYGGSAENVANLAGYIRMLQDVVSP